MTRQNGDEETDGELETPTVRCPHCRADVYDDLDFCPHCGEYFPGESGTLGTKPAWFVGLGLLGILAVILVLSGLLQLL